MSEAKAKPKVGCPSCGRAGIGSRSYAAQLPLPLANAFDEWLHENGTNANRAIKQFIALALQDRKFGLVSKQAEGA